MAQPDESHTLEVALAAAALADEHTPGASLFVWLVEQQQDPLTWDATSRQCFLELLRTGGPRAWRFITMTAVLHRSLPELAEAVAELQSEAYEFDPIAHLDWPTLAAVRNSLASEDRRSEPADLVLLAALALDATDDDPVRASRIASSIGLRLGLGDEASSDLFALLDDLPAFVQTAHSVAAFDEVRDSELAGRVGSAERVRALEVLARAQNAGDVLLDRRIEVLADHLVSSLRET